MNHRCLSLLITCYRVSNLYPIFRITYAQSVKLFAALFTVSLLFRQFPEQNGWMSLSLTVSDSFLCWKVLHEHVFLVFLSKWDSELWFTGYYLFSFKFLDSKKEAVASSTVSMEEEHTQTYGECITLCFIQVNNNYSPKWRWLGYD